MRYQPCALADAKLSRVILTDFVQLTNDRLVVVSVDPSHPRKLKVIDNRIVGSAPRRLVYAETIEINDALISQPPLENRQAKVD